MAVKAMQMSLNDDKALVMLNVIPSRYTLSFSLRPDHRTTTSQNLDDFVTITMNENKELIYEPKRFILKRHLYFGSHTEVVVMIFLVVSAFLLLLFKLFKRLRYTVVKIFVSEFVVFKFY